MMSQKEQSKRTLHQLQLIKPFYTKSSTQKMALVLVLPSLAGVTEEIQYGEIRATSEQELP